VWISLWILNPIQKLFLVLEEATCDFILSSDSKSNAQKWRVAILAQMKKNQYNHIN